jgi:hypothetical protein
MLRSLNIEIARVENHTSSPRVLSTLLIGYYQLHLQILARFSSPAQILRHSDEALEYGACCPWLGRHFSTLMMGAKTLAVGGRCLYSHRRLTTCNKLEGRSGTVCTPEIKAPRL